MQAVAWSFNLSPLIYSTKTYIHNIRGQRDIEIDRQKDRLSLPRVAKCGGGRGVVKDVLEEEGP